MNASTDGQPDRTPPRLFVYLATEAPRAVVLRRGPTDWVRLSLWHTETDQFEHGQWLHARVYERRCDVAPDGELFAYFAHRGRGPARDLEVDSWAAISRPPWFTALAAWGIGSTYFAGGFFHASDALYLGGVTDAPDRGDVPSSMSLRPDLPERVASREWTERLVYFNRLLRGGWAPRAELEAGLDAEAPAWSRSLSNGGPSLLVMLPPAETAPGDFGERAFSEYVLEDGERRLPLDRATWVDWDHSGRLVMAADGVLSVVDPSDGTRRTIADFNSQGPANLAPSGSAQGVTRAMTLARSRDELPSIA